MQAKALKILFFYEHIYDRLKSSIVEYADEVKPRG